MAVSMSGIKAKILILRWDIMRGMLTKNHYRAAACLVGYLNALG